MSKQSDAVKKWRKTTKTKLAGAFGGKCGICGYCKCDDVLDFHHIDPTQKEFSFGSIRANCKNWGSIVLEIKKCVMLCSNCHREYHAGLISDEIILTLPRFDENCGLLKELKDRANQIYYCNCGNERKKHSEFCSPECFSKSRQKVDWSSIDLLSELKTKTNSQLANELGVSEATIRKRKKKTLQ